MVCGTSQNWPRYVFHERSIGSLSWQNLSDADGQGFKANYFDADTGQEYWISGCRKDGMDALDNTDVEIDDDVREEYWTQIRKQPENVDVKVFRAVGKCK